MGKNAKQRVRERLGLVRSTGWTPIALVLRHLVGGKDRFMEFAEYVGQIEPELQKVVDTYHSLKPTERKKVSLDALCMVHKVDPIHFIRVVGEAALKFRDNAAIVMIALNMPQAIARSIQQAMKPEGKEDRKMLFQHAGIIPVAAGQTINVKATANAAAKAETITATPKGLPSFEQSMMESDAILRGRE